VYRRHKLAAGALVVAVLLLVVNVVLALGQWDRGAQSFGAESPLQVDLLPGDKRIVYLNADESDPLNFDFYPSDFTCASRSPDGASAPLDSTHGRRLLNIWDEHAAVASLVADTGGTYVVSCEGRRDAELLLARPPRFTVSGASPEVGVDVLVFVVLVGSVVSLVAAAGTRLRQSRGS
jgi:hypothetical protein